MEAWYKVLHEFRNWNKEWDSMFAKKPDSVDKFIEELSKKYKIEEIKSINN